MQVADIRERLDDAKQQEGTLKLDSLKASFNQKKAEGERKKAKAEENARPSRASIGNRDDSSSKGSISPLDPGK
ncbi:hypothetical protein JCM16303_001312 [Sporobolomyces ruberrimus]